VHAQTEIRLFYLITLLLILWIVIERVKLREMACSQEKSEWAIPLGVVVFIAVLNSIAFSLISMVILDSVYYTLVLTLVVGLYLIVSCSIVSGSFMEVRQRMNNNRRNALWLAGLSFTVSMLICAYITSFQYSPVVVVFPLISLIGIIGILR